MTAACHRGIPLRAEKKVRQHQLQHLTPDAQRQTEQAKREETYFEATLPSDVYTLNPLIPHQASTKAPGVLMTKSAQVPGQPLEAKVLPARSPHRAVLKLDRKREEVMSF
jgi:hypothetical protein